MSSRKRTFCPNGRVNPNHHFFVNPALWNEQQLLPLLKEHRFVSLIAPSQSGKTTRMYTLQQQLQVEKDILPVFIHMSDYVTHRQESFFEQFVKLMQNSIESTYRKQVNITARGFSDLFDKEARGKWYFQRDVVLLIDEVDLLRCVSEKERANFLTKLRAYKQSDPSQTSLRSCLIVTNWIGDYLIDTLGNSPFNINYRLQAPYFSLDDVKALFQQYIDQEGAAIDDKIIEYIFEQTSGAQGLVAMYGKCLDEIRTELKRVPTFSEWFTYCNSNQFGSIIVQYPNYQKMIKLLENNKNIHETLLAKLYGTELPLIIPSEIYTANIFTTEGTFANPFVRRMVANYFYSILAPPTFYPVPLDDNGLIDFLKIIEDCLSYINPAEILGATPKTANRCNKHVKPGPKEVVYVLAFKRALEKLLSNISIVLHYPEEDVDKQSCDMVISIINEKIAVEHGANLIVSPDNNQRDSIKHHVKEQAENYHKGLKADQTWVINWTNVPMSTGQKQVQYYFPESDTVRTVYIYHDIYFKHIELVTKGDSNDLIVKCVERDSITIRRQNTGESEPKRRRLNNSILVNENQLQIDVRQYEKIDTKLYTINVTLQDKQYAIYLHTDQKIDNVIQLLQAIKVQLVDDEVLNESDKISSIELKSGSVVTKTVLKNMSLTPTSFVIQIE
jgi:hypothetical protein